MADSNRVHGPYRSKKCTPRQTKYMYNRSRKHKERQDYMVDNQELDVHNQQISNSWGPTHAQDGPLSLEQQRAIQTLAPPMIAPKLFERSEVTKVSSELSIKAFLSCHHLSQEDLLDLIHLHMPPSSSSSIPSSVFTLQKYSSINPISAKSALHYLCPLCWSNLPNDRNYLCPNPSCYTASGDDLKDLPLLILQSSYN